MFLKARYIKNKPIVNMDPQTQKFVEMQSEIKALRDELHRQRLLSAKLSSKTPIQDEQANANNVQQIKQLESKIQLIQGESDHYKKLVKEAHSRFRQLNKLDSTTSETKKLTDEWVQLFEAVSLVMTSKLNLKQK